MGGLSPIREGNEVNEKQDSRDTIMNIKRELDDVKQMHQNFTESVKARAFLDYVKTSTMGVDIFGISITYELVLTISKQMLLYMPVVLEILAHFFQLTHESQ